MYRNRSAHIFLFGFLLVAWTYVILKIIYLEMAKRKSLKLGMDENKKICYMQLFIWSAWLKILCNIYFTQTSSNNNNKSKNLIPFGSFFFWLQWQQNCLLPQIREYWRLNRKICIHDANKFAEIFEISKWKNTDSLHMVSTL